MESAPRTARTRAGSKVIILLEDDKAFYGVYESGELYPARWDKKGYFVTQPEKGEYKTALDLVFPAPIRIELKSA